MADSGAVVVCQVLSGTGGVGKTQLAAHYVRRKWSAQELDLIVWVTAGNRDAIVSAYARAGRQVAGADDSDPVDAAGEFLTWLETTDRRWLVVLDDLADPGDLSGLWPPRHSTGRTIVTTRRRDAAIFGTGRRPVIVDLFTLKEASDYLTAALAAHNRHDDPDQIRAMATDLGFLPLALAQAAAYVIDRHLECAEYRRRFADRRRTLAELLPEHGALPDEQRTTVAATWSLSIELADQLAPRGLARPMLQLASMLDPNDIPIVALTSTPALEYLGSHRTPVSTDTQIESRPVLAEVSQDAAREALYCLHRLSLADFADDLGERGLRVHGLIQRATRDQLAANEFDDVVDASAQALLHVWASARTIAENAILRGNAEVLYVNAGSRLWSLSVYHVLFEVGSSLRRDRLFAAASSYWRQLYPAAEDHLGPDHPHTFLVRSYDAGMQAVAGDRAGAMAAWKELLADQLRALGPDHPDTLSTRNYLANWQGVAGDRAGAVAAFEELLAERLRALGPDHPDTLSTRNYLANWRMAAGDRAGAVAAWEELLAERLRVLGPDHPDTLSTRAALADQRGVAGDRAGAVAAWEELLAERLRVLGPDHPDTLSTRAALADQRGVAGDRAGAVAASEELLAERLRALGPDHPDTLSARAALANWRTAAGDRAGAVAAWEELLAERLRLLGPDHPDTLSTRAALADQRGAAGDRAGAVAAFEELLAERLRVLGPDHRYTLFTRATLANWRGAAGDRAGAVAASEELLAERLRVLGPDHPDTLSTRAILANWRAAAGDRAGAVAAFEELLAERLRVLGPDHRDTLSARAALAAQRGAAGDRAGAVAASEELLAERLRVLGPDHPDTLSARAALANWRAAAGDRAGVVAAFEELLAERLRVLGPDHPDTLSTRAALVASRDPRPQSSERPSHRSESLPVQSPAANASDGSYVVRWHAADGTEQSMGPFYDVDTAEGVCMWIRRGKGTAVEVVGYPGEETSA